MLNYRSIERSYGWDEIAQRQKFRKRDVNVLPKTKILKDRYENI